MSDCHVFDCGALADDVLATIGQSFTIMQEVRVVSMRSVFLTQTLQKPELADPSRV